MDGDGVGKYVEMEVDIQRAFSVFPTIAIKWSRGKWTFTVTVFFQQTGKFFLQQPFVKHPFPSFVLDFCCRVLVISKLCMIKDGDTSVHNLYWQGSFITSFL